LWLGVSQFAKKSALVVIPNEVRNLSRFESRKKERFLGTQLIHCTGTRGLALRSPLEIATMCKYDSATMMNASYFSERFASALPYDRYVQTGSEEQQRRWSQVHDVAQLTDPQKQLVGGFVREMKILIFSGIWCGDCVEQCPLIHRIAEANPKKIELRFVERPRDGELVAELRINGGNRVPVVVFLSEDNQWCATAGDRTINRYRAIALRKLGPLCPTGIVPPDKEELAATLDDWLNEVERIQLMLRLTPRLRQKYQD
jgi:thiol-disulfide isomerase/thioredoxin